MDISNQAAAAVARKAQQGSGRVGVLPKFIDWISITEAGLSPTGEEDPQIDLGNTPA